MANLPADLPTNWTQGQIISPNGTEVGLSEQYGYNYLNEQVNNTQTEVNSLGTAQTNTQQQVNTLNTQVGNIQGQVTTQGQSITALQQTTTTQGQSITSLQSQVSSNDTDISNLQQTTTTQGQNITTLQGQVSTLSQTTTTQGESITSLQSQVSSNDTDISNLQQTTTTQGQSISTLETEVDDLKNSVSDGKTLVANAITAKGVTTATDATFQTMADNIANIPTAYVASGSFTYSSNSLPSSYTLSLGIDFTPDYIVVAPVNLQYRPSQFISLIWYNVKSNTYYVTGKPQAAGYYLELSSYSDYPLLWINEPTYNDNTKQFTWYGIEQGSYIDNAAVYQGTYNWVTWKG